MTSWAMKVEHFLAHTDYPILGEIVRERKREKQGPPCLWPVQRYLAKFHKMDDDKKLGCHSNIDLKDSQKAMDRFQSILSQLEIHGAGVSTEDENQKFLRSLPFAWSQVSLIMRTKPGALTAHHPLATKCCFCLWRKPAVSNELTLNWIMRILEQMDEYDLEEKWNLNGKWHMISMRMKKFYKKTGRKLQFDAKEPVGFDKTKVECYNCHKTGHFARECRIKGTQDKRRKDAWNSGNKDGSRFVQKEDSKALVTVDGEGVDWTNHSEDEDYALMACNSSDSDTDDSEDECMSIPTKQQETSSFANKKVKTPRENVKSQFTHSHKPKVDKKNMGQECAKPVNKQNQFVPSAVLTKTGTIPVSTARQSFNRQTVLTSTAIKVNTVKPHVNRVRPANVFHQQLIHHLQGLSKDYQYLDRFFKSNNLILLRHMTGNKAYLAEFQDFNGGPVAFGGSRGYITGKGKIKTALTTDDKREGPREEEQVFMDDLERLKRQEKEAYEEAEVLRKKFEHLVIKEGAARTNSTNIFSIVSTPAKASSTNLVYTGVVADFTNLEPVVNVSPIPTSRIHSTHPRALILGDPNSAVQTRSKISEALEGEAGVMIFKKNYWVKEVVVVSNKAKRFKCLKPTGYSDPKYPQKVYKVVKARLRGYISFPELSKQKEDGYLYKSGDKYVAENPEEVKHLVFIVSLTASRPDIMFAVCACSRFQVTPKSSHLSAVKRIFRYLKGKPKLGLWYPRVSSFDLESYSDSDYAGANLDRKSTTGGCQFLGRRLISWQCKKQTIVATSTTEAEYVAAASCCGQVLWIQNQMLDYGFNFMNTKIYIDNESTICIVKNPVYHSKTKHIAIRHHFIRDAYEKKLIQVLKIHTDDNVADLLTKAFDVSRGLIRFRESLRRVSNGTKALLIPTLFILWLDIVSTDSAKLVPLGKVCTAIETLKKNTAKVPYAISLKYISYLQALISLLPTITLSTTMAVLDSCPKHNMVAYLEKTEGNAEFHEIIDFLKRSSIHHALTVSPVVSTTFVEQFWTSAKSKIINNVRHITAKVAGKSVSISEASIRSDLLFDDADGIDSLPNQAIFDAIQLMGYEGDLTVLTFNKALFSPQWRFLFHTINHCLSSKSTSWDQIPTNIATAVICLTSNQKYNFSKLIFDGMLRHLDAKKKFVMYPRFISIFLDKQLANVSVPLDHFPVNTLTSKVFSFMVKKGKHFSGKVTPLFATMLVQPTQDEGASSERPSEALPTPSPAPTSEVPYEPHTDSSPAHTSEVPIEHQPDPSPRPSPTTTIPDSIPESFGENLGGHSSSDKSLSGNEGDMTIQGVYDICLSLCQQVSDQAKEIQALKAQITKLKKQAKPSVSKQGRKFAKGESSVQRDPLFDEVPEDTVDHMDTENAQSEGRTREIVDEDKEIDEVRLSTEDVVSTDKEGVSTDFEKVSTDRPIVSTDGSKVSTDRQIEGTDEQVEGTEEHNEGTEEIFEGTEEQREGTEEIFEGTEEQREGTEEKVESTDGQIQECWRTIAKVLLNMSQAKAVSKEKEKGVELIQRQRKKKIEEEDESKSESDGIPQAEKKFKQLERDEELA
ncbi:putative ribonuclease H-like domain-containing protein [Tanacetum coccineum]|uniref:Ribonuclease H-like domain-containing protein n=1 Tax=Tanacetum coccineum TaxID=301880 RepID=A0ABQ5C891_9ASTR